MRVCFCAETDSSSVVARHDVADAQVAHDLELRVRRERADEAGFVEQVEHRGAPAFGRRAAAFGHAGDARASPSSTSAASAAARRSRRNATASPRRDPCTRDSQSSNAAAQCRIIGRFTGSGATLGPVSLIGFPTSAASRSSRVSRVMEVASWRFGRSPRQLRSAFGEVIVSTPRGALVSMRVPRSHQDRSSMLIMQCGNTTDFAANINAASNITPKRASCVRGSQASGGFEDGASQGRTDMEARANGGVCSSRPGSRCAYDRAKAEAGVGGDRTPAVRVVANCEGVSPLPARPGRCADRHRFGCGAHRAVLCDSLCLPQDHRGRAG